MTTIKSIYDNIDQKKAEGLGHADLTSFLGSLFNIALDVPHQTVTKISM